MEPTAPDSLSTEQGIPELLERCASPELDKILGRAFPVIDQGFVRLVDYMGDEGAIVQAARVSYGKGTKQVNEDRGLLRYLMRHWHTTPFEMCELKLHVRVPMDCWRQWIRHRTASVNEYSTRYSEAIDAAQMTARGEWRAQAKTNRQGSGGYLPEDPTGMFLSVIEENHLKSTRDNYEKLLEQGVAREQARKVLSLSTYTEAYWKVDLKNLLGFLALRMDSHAQKEIRDYATVIGEQIVAPWLPNVWEAFNDYHPLRGAMTLTRLELAVIRAAMDMSDPDAQYNAVEQAARFGWLRLTKRGKLARNRERGECEEKLKAMNISLPWGDIEFVKEAIDNVCN